MQGVKVNQRSAVASLFNSLASVWKVKTDFDLIDKKGQILTDK